MWFYPIIWSIFIWKKLEAWIIVALLFTLLPRATVSSMTFVCKIIHFLPWQLSWPFFRIHCCDNSFLQTRTTKCWKSSKGEFLDICFEKIIVSLLFEFFRDYQKGGDKKRLLFMYIFSHHLQKISKWWLLNYGILRNNTQFHLWTGLLIFLFLAFLIEIKSIVTKGAKAESYTLTFIPSSPPTLLKPTITLFKTIQKMLFA